MRAISLIVRVTVLLALCTSLLPRAQVSASVSAIDTYTVPLTLTDHADRVSVSDGQFIFDLYKGAAGYNKIYYADGSVAVYDDRVTLEYFNPGGQWKLRGIPIDTSYVQSEDEITVTRHYDDSLGTTYDVDYLFRTVNPVKITIRLHSGQTDDYRMVWSSKGVTQTSYVSRTTSVDFGTIIFDWLDVYQTLGDITATTVGSHAQGRKTDITFNIGSVAEGANLVIDPSLVSTSEHSSVTAFPGQRRLTRLSDETLYAIYHKKLADKYQIYVKKSTDDGVSWTDETRISTYDGMSDYSQERPSIAGDSSDYLHAVWHGPATGYTGYAQVWYSKYTDSWSPPVRISTYNGMGDSGQESPSIAVDSSNNLHVVWSGKATGYTDEFQIWYAKYTDSWITPVRISTYAGMGTKDQYYPSIAGDSSDYLHVVWYGTADGYVSYAQIWYAKYTDSWATPVRISTYNGMDVNAQFLTSIAADLDDYLHVVWSGKAEGHTTYNQIWYTTYTDSWSTPIRISDYSLMQNYAQDSSSIAASSNGDLHVVWHGKASGYTDNNKVWYAEYTDSWSTPACLQATGKNAWPTTRWSWYPSSNVPFDGVDYIFTEGIASPYDIYWDKTGDPFPSPLPTVVTQAATNVTATTATLNGEITNIGAGSVDERGFDWDIDSGAPYANNWTEEGTFGTGTFDHGVTGLPPDDWIYFRAKAHNAEGWGYGSELFFDTPLPLPGPPTDFTLSAPLDSVLISWTKGLYADTTVIRCQRGSYPETVTDGVEVYNNTGTSTEHSVEDLSMNEYYYRAWSHNATGYSVAYAGSSIGGENMQLLAIFGGLIALCLGITAISFHFKNVWWLFAAGLVWFVFSISMITMGPSVGDYGVPFRTGLGGVGFMGTFICFLTTFRTWKQGRVVPLDEQTSYRRQLTKMTKDAEQDKLHRRRMTSGRRYRT